MFKKFFMTVSLIVMTGASLFSLDSVVEEKSGPFALNPVLDSTLIAMSAGLNGAVYYFDTVHGVNNPDFDGNIFDPFQVNRFDRMLMNPYSSAIDDLGTYLGIVSALTPSVLLAASSDQWLTIGTMYAETMMLAYGIKELGKLCFSRARPFMYYDDYPREAVDDHDWNKSFPSGHTTLAFAGASFTGSVFSEYFPGSKWKIPVIGSSYLLALGTASCRVASGDHFLTDVIAGIIAGTACGYIIPRLHSQTIRSQKYEEESTFNLGFQVTPSSLFLTLKY